MMKKLFVSFVVSLVAILFLSTVSLGAASETVIIDDYFDGPSLDTTKFDVITTGIGDVSRQSITWGFYPNHSGAIVINSGYGGPGSAVVKSKEAFSLTNTPMIIFEGMMSAYSEGHWYPGVYGDRQPRGLRVGTDPNNAIEFISYARDTVEARTVANGVVTVSRYILPPGTRVERISEWVKYRIEATLNSVKFYVDDVLIATHTTNIPTGPLNLYVGTSYDGYGNVNIWADWLYLAIAEEVDTTPPVLTLPADITVEGNTTGGATGVALGTATASDIVDSSPTVTSDAPSFFPLGVTVVTWTVTDASGNSASDTQTVTVVDTTPPTITAVVSISVTVGAPSSVLPAPIVSDIVDSSPTVTNNAPSIFPAGVTVVTWTATDASGNSATATTTVTATYNFGGFLPPLGPGPSAFKAGSTIPVKFQLRDADGNFVTNAVARIYVKKISNGTEIPGVSTSAATTGNLFRYCSDCNQYIFNLNTKPLSTGTWQIRIELNDGTSQYVYISLK